MQIDLSKRVGDFFGKLISDCLVLADVEGAAEAVKAFARVTGQDPQELWSELMEEMANDQEA